MTDNENQICYTCENAFMSIESAPCFGCTIRPNSTVPIPDRLKNWRPKEPEAEPENKDRQRRQDCKERMDIEGWSDGFHALALVWDMGFRRGQDDPIPKPEPEPEGNDEINPFGIPYWLPTGTVPGLGCHEQCEHASVPVNKEPCKTCYARTIFPGYTPKKPKLPDGAIEARKLEEHQCFITEIHMLKPGTSLCYGQVYRRAPSARPDGTILARGILGYSNGPWMDPDTPVYLVTAEFKLKGKDDE